MKKKIILPITIICYIYLSYLTFISFQGLLTLISKQGSLIFPLIGIALNVFVIQGLILYIYGIVFKERAKEYHFSRYYAYYLSVTGLLALGFMIYEMIYYFNLGYGITPLYPLNYVLIDAITLGLGIYNFIKLKSLDKGESYQKQHILYKIITVLFTFIAFDRLGVVITSICTTDINQILILIPIYLLSLSSIIALVFYIIYRRKPSKKMFIIPISVCLAFLLIGAIYTIVMLYGANATPFIKMISPFYGLDRISSLPISILFVPLFTLGVLIYSIVKYIKNNKIAK